jgi:hypothetical protein
LVMEKAPELNTLKHTRMHLTVLRDEGEDVSHFVHITRYYSPLYVAVMSAVFHVHKNIS